MDTTPSSFFGVIEPICAAADPRMLDQLAALVAKHNIDVLIPTVSDELPAVAMAAEGGLFGHALAAIAPADGVTKAHDKYVTMRALATAGINTPLFGLPSDYESVEAAFEAMGAPLIIKPRVGRGGRGVRVLERNESIAWEDLTDKLILQQYASGIEYAPMVFRAGDTHAPLVVVVEKTELKQGRVGNAVSTKRVENRGVPEVVSVAAGAVQALGLVGAVDLDIRRLANGDPVVLEINARFGANSCQAPEILVEVLQDAAARCLQVAK
ncbi:carbamoyl-phosphate synthase large subunit [Paeniglutamicibacter kerguelensis]|uniref:Carbamoyl-phosphate synthase large subunit n=2 Tax=Paeniglutamicibacter kerguelensis TaxID=254788 RepID=A0ABS4X9E5_9MICC|nr:carbamoyl-phosphate synthase large subunit [Paeniglutamicibacter kerguelensis]